MVAMTPAWIKPSCCRWSAEISETGPKPAQSVHRSESAESDKSAFVVVLYKIDSFLGHLLSRHGSSSENLSQRQIIAILKDFAIGFEYPFVCEYP